MDWDEIGKGDREAQNPPGLNAHDYFVFRWFSNHCSLFTKDFNLIPELLKDLNLEADEKTLFIYKLSMIYQSQYDLEKRKIDKEMKRSQRDLKFRKKWQQ